MNKSNPFERDALSVAGHDQEARWGSSRRARLLGMSVVPFTSFAGAAVVLTEMDTVLTETAQVYGAVGLFVLGLTSYFVTDARQP